MGLRKEVIEMPIGQEARMSRHHITTLCLAVNQRGGNPGGAVSAPEAHGSKPFLIAGEVKAVAVGTPPFIAADEAVLRNRDFCKCVIREIQDLNATSFGVIRVVNDYLGAVW